MAKQTGLFRFTGKLDNVIGYRRNGKHCVRSMPETVRQTPATRQAARNFGVASRKGRLVRRAITPYLGRYDGTTVNRLNKALVQLPNQQLQGLEGFRFNRHTGLDKLLPLLPVISGDGLLKVPAQELPRFPRATHLEICLIAARLNFAERRIEDVQAVTEIIALKEDFMGLELELPHVAGKGTLVLTVQVQACDSTNGRIQPMHDRRFMAADIIAVIPPRRHDKERRKHGFSFAEKQAVNRGFNAAVIAGSGAQAGKAFNHAVIAESSTAKARWATKQSPEYRQYSRGLLRPPGSQ